MGVPSLLYERLGAIIKKHRRRLGLTQEHLSSQLGISRAALANVETGRQRVLVHQLYSLAEQLDIKVSALLPASEENKTFRVLDGLPFSENVSLAQGQQIARLLQLPSASGGQHAQSRRNRKARKSPS